MGKQTNKFKQFIMDEKLIRNKSFIEIEREHGVLRGTTYSWVQRYKKGTLFVDKRTKKDSKSIEVIEYEFLKKSFALLIQIRSKQQG